MCWCSPVLWEVDRTVSQLQQVLETICGTRGYFTYLLYYQFYYLYSAAYWCRSFISLVWQKQQDLKFASAQWYPYYLAVLTIGLLHNRWVLIEEGGLGWDRMAVALIPQCDGKLFNSNHIRVTWPWDLTAKNFVQLKESERAAPTRLVDLRLHFLFCCIEKSSLFPSYPTPNPCPHT